jgi:Flp pilus assembly protein TadD
MTIPTTTTRAVIASDPSEGAAPRDTSGPAGSAWLALGLVLVGGALLYAGSLDAPFVFDDLPAIVDNPRLKSPIDWGALFAFMPARIVAMATFAANLSVGDSPASLRVVNIAIHLAATALVFTLVLQLLARTRGRRSTDVALALVAAAVFVAHPLQTQAVTYIWQRVASLASALYLGALVLHVEALRRRASGQPWAPVLAAAMGVGLLGMFTKQTVFTLPLAAIMLSAVTRRTPTAQAERPLLLAWLPLLTVIPLTIVAFGDMQVADMEAGGERARSPGAYFLTQWQAVALYWRLTLLPFGQSLVHDLPTGSLASPTTWACGALHLGVIGLALVVRRRLPLVCAGLLFFYLALGVESSFVPLLDEVFEHRVYLPMAGVALALAGALAAGVERLGDDQAPRQRALIAAALLLTLPLAWLTTERHAVWADPAALWEEAADNAPDDFPAQWNAGLHRFRAGDTRAALPHLSAAHRLRPDDTEAASQLGAALCLSDRCDDGVALLATTYARDPSPLVRSQYVTALAQLGRFTEAADLMGQAPPMGPSGAALYAKLLLDAGRPQQALEHLQAVIASAPPGAQGGPQMRALDALVAEAKATLAQPTLDQDTPGQDTPGQDTPGQDTPGQDTPGQDTPGQDTPGQDPRTMSAPTSPQLRRLVAVSVFALLAITTAVYAGALSAPFMFDDFIYIVDNPHLQHLNVLALLEFYPSRAVAFLTLVANRVLHGFDPAPYRVVNLALHLISGLLVFGLLWLLLDEVRERRPRDVGLSALGAGLFLAHPLQVQAVTYVWQRVASLAACFYLAALLLHLVAVRRRRAAREGADHRWAPWLLAALVAGLLSMLTKQNAFTLPFAIVLLTWLSGGRAALKRDQPLLLAWAPTLLVIPLLMLVFGDRSAMDIAESDHQTRTPLVYFLTQWEVVALYWRLAVLPFGQSVIHDVPSGSLTSGATWGYGLLHAALLAGAWRVRARRPLLCAGVLFAYLALSVESTFVPLIDEAFEHRMYLPLFGVALAVVALVDAACERWTALGELRAGRAAVIAVGLTLPLALLTVERNAVWSDTVRLWREAAHNAPADHTAQLNAGLALVREQRFAEAIPYLSAARDLRPTHTRASIQLAVALCETGRCEEGLPVIKRTYGRDPSPVVVETYATTLARLGRLGEAADLMAAHPPTSPGGRLLFGRLLIDAGRPQHAVSVVTEALEAAPPSARDSPRFAELQALVAEARAAVAALEQATTP